MDKHKVRCTAQTQSISEVAIARTTNLDGATWDSWFDGQGVSDDFMPEREQSDEQVRDPSQVKV